MDISSPVDEAVGAETAATIIVGLLVTKSKYFSIPFSLPEEGRQACQKLACVHIA